MSLPASVRAAVDEATRRIGSGTIDDVAPVAGGCINNGARVGTASGTSYFLKWNPSTPPGMFAAETDGLDALRAEVGHIDSEYRPRVPQPIASGDESGEEGGCAWLLMQWIAPGPPTATGDERLGRGLAHLHASTGMAAAPFGWPTDNWIGSLPQSNRVTTEWADFWRNERIAPQLDLVRRRGHLIDALLDDLMDVIPDALVGVESPELLHGDLWSGNCYPTHDGAMALVDPAVYRGDGEVDLAMTELFGGFGPSFYDAYDDVRAISAGYRSHRRPLYQLYYLLVHLNLFGRSYEAGCRRAATAVLAAVG